MSAIVDARGLSCPQPVILALDEMKKQNSGEIEILVDTDTSKENVSRAAASKGWEIKEIQDSGEGYRLIIEKR